MAVRGFEVRFGQARLSTFLGEMTVTTLISKVFYPKAGFLTNPTSVPLKFSEAEKSHLRLPEVEGVTIKTIAGIKVTDLNAIADIAVVTISVAGTRGNDNRRNEVDQWTESAHPDLKKPLHTPGTSSLHCGLTLQVPLATKFPSEPNDRIPAKSPVSSRITGDPLLPR